MIDPVSSGTNDLRSTSALFGVRQWLCLCRFGFSCFASVFSVEWKAEETSRNKSGRAKHCRTPKKAEPLTVNPRLPLPSVLDVESTLTNLAGSGGWASL